MNTDDLHQPFDELWPIEVEILRRELQARVPELERILAALDAAQRVDRSILDLEFTI